MTMNEPKTKRRWYHLTPDKFLIALLPIVGLLFLSERFWWFLFKEQKNWTVLTAIAIVCVAIAFLLLWFGLSLVLRHPFQFHIRSLMVLVVVVAVVCSWFAVRMQQARRQREVVTAAGLASYDYEWDGLPGPPGPLWLRNLVGVDFLCDVRTLSYVQATDADLERLKGLASLDMLGLNHTEVTDAGLMHLKGLSNLKMLGLNCTEVTDAGLVHLKRLPSLQEVTLWNTQVTDAGLVHLKGLTSLRRLYLDGTQVSDDGVQDLRKALPNCCRIDREGSANQ